MSNSDYLKRLVQSRSNSDSFHQESVSQGLPTVTSCDGLFMIIGAGEATQIVNFPVRFIERPNFVYGGEVDPGSAVISGAFPTVSVVVVRWNLDRVAGYSKQYFLGAELAVVTTGAASQRLWIHWRATGRALTNPGTA